MFFKIFTSSSSFRNFFIIVLCIILLPLLVLFIAHVFPLRVSGGVRHLPVTFDNLHKLPVRKIAHDAPFEKARNPNCSHYDCFNIYKCGHLGETKIQIYVYPLAIYQEDSGAVITSQMSMEFYKILKTIVDSPYYTANPEQACLFVPSIDTLNQNRFNVRKVSQVLHSLPL